MRSTLKAAFAGLVAASALAASVASASANTLVIDDLDFHILWMGLQFEGGMGELVRCPALVEGTFHHINVNKVFRTLVGHVTDASIDPGECEGGSVTIQQGTLPWHVQFVGYAEELPEISSIAVAVVGAGIAVQNRLGTCLARSSVTEPLGLAISRNAGNGTLEEVTPMAEAIDATDVNGSLCDLFGIDGILAGTGTLEDADGNRLILTLPMV